MFEWLENTSVALWVGESLWAYPFMLSLHVVGLAIVVGILSMVDFKLLGGFKGIRVGSFLPLLKFAWIGFLINAVSGVFLFTSQATYFVTSTTFLIKLGCIFIGAILTKVMQGQLVEAEAAGNADDVSMQGLAIVSLLLWLVAITAGRLTAYI
jgi:hypothetical protein